MKRLLSVLVISVALLLPMTANAATAKVDVSCDNKACVDNGDTCQRTCSIGLVGDESFAVGKFEGTLTLSDSRVKLSKVTAADGWTNVNVGNLEKLNLTTTNGANKTGSKIALATFVLDIPKGGDVDCTVTLTAGDYGKADIKVEVDEEVVKTGATLPLAILACGIAAAGVVYFVSKKNTKMYKI